MINWLKIVSKKDEVVTQNKEKFGSTYLKITKGRPLINGSIKMESNNGTTVRFPPTC